jgi:hypothetical protein
VLINKSTEKAGSKAAVAALAGNGIPSLLSSPRLKRQKVFL